VREWSAGQAVQLRVAMERLPGAHGMNASTKKTSGRARADGSKTGKLGTTPQTSFLSKRSFRARQVNRSIATRSCTLGPRSIRALPPTPRPHRFAGSDSRGDFQWRGMTAKMNRAQKINQDVRPQSFHGQQIYFSFRDGIQGIFGAVITSLCRASQRQRFLMRPGFVVCEPSQPEAGRGSFAGDAFGNFERAAALLQCGFSACTPGTSALLLLSSPVSNSSHALANVHGQRLVSTLCLSWMIQVNIRLQMRLPTTGFTCRDNSLPHTNRSDVLDGFILSRKRRRKCNEDAQMTTRSKEELEALGIRSSVSLLAYNVCGERKSTGRVVFSRRAAKSQTRAIYTRLR